MKFIIIVAIIAIVLAVFVGIRSCDTEPDMADIQPVTEEVATETPATETGGQMVDVGGHRLYVRTYGSGDHTVVIEPGIGDAATIWRDVVDALEGEMRVILYDRAGYGESEAGPMPRTAGQVANELDALLKNTPGLEPPYIVVGHSIGAINAMVFSSEYTNLVEGLVLLDPPPVDFIRGRRFPQLRAMADSMTAGFRADAERARAGGDPQLARQFEALASEHDEMFRSGGTWVETIPSLGTMPLVVVASGVPNPQFGADAEEFQRFWRDSSQQLTALSVRGEFVYAEDSTHDLPGDATETVVQAIRRVVAMAGEPLEPVYYEGDK